MIHNVIETKEALIRITREVVEDFVKDGIVYAEIRTTPREYTVGEYISEKDGIDIILNIIKEMERKYSSRIHIRLLLSINRSESKYDRMLARFLIHRGKAMRTAQLAIHYRNSKEYHIVGVDLSGNPTVYNDVKEI